MRDNQIIFLQFLSISFLPHFVGFVLVLVGTAACLLKLSAHGSDHVLISAIVQTALESQILLHVLIELDSVAISELLEFALAFVFQILELAFGELVLLAD